MKQNQVQQKEIRLGTHGENYGSWMSNPVFYVIGALLALSVVLAVLSFAVFHITALGVVFVIAALLLLALLLWITWIRRQYAFGGGGMMEQVHQVVLSHLDFDGQGQLLDVGCGSGALSIRAALTWRAAQVVGIDYWGSAYGYGQAMCEKNAASEGVAARCRFQHGDANKLDFPDESFDAVVSNYVYHNVMGADKQALLLETLRVLKKGGVFAINDNMNPRAYGDMEAFAQELRDMGYEDVRLIDTAHGGLRLPPAGGHDDAGRLPDAGGAQIIGRWKMVQMLLAEGMLLCSLFWAFCWLGTGSDEKNIRNFSTYPDEVQKIVKARPELSGNIRQRGPAAIFAGNLLLFTALLFAMGLLTRQEYFAGNFLNTLLLGQALNLFDFLVIDLLWWRHTKRVRFSGTEESPELYADPRKHFYAFLRGVLLFLAVALINGYLLTWI